jgi:hypothetical protein
VRKSQKAFASIQVLTEELMVATSAILMISEKFFAFQMHRNGDRIHRELEEIPTYANFLNQNKPSVKTAWHSRVYKSS